MRRTANCQYQRTLTNREVEPVRKIVDEQQKTVINLTKTAASLKDDVETLKKNYAKLDVSYVKLMDSITNQGLKMMALERLNLDDEQRNLPLIPYQKRMPKDSMFVQNQRMPRQTKEVVEPLQSAEDEESDLKSIAAFVKKNPDLLKMILQYNKSL